MRYAIINNYIVEEIVEMFDQTEILEKARKCQNMIDITGVTPEPSVNWKFDGINLVYIGE
jgi:hypothetical protein